MGRAFEAPSSSERRLSFLSGNRHECAGHVVGRIADTSLPRADGIMALNTTCHNGGRPPAQQLLIFRHIAIVTVVHANSRHATRP